MSEPGPESRPFTATIHLELWAPTKEAALEITKALADHCFQDESVGALAFDKPQEGELELK